MRAMLSQVRKHGPGAPRVNAVTNIPRHPGHPPTVSLNSTLEMAAVGYSALNRVEYFAENPDTKLNFFGATDKSLSGVINSNQYGSVGSANWNLAGNTSSINAATPGGAKICSFFQNVFSTAASVKAKTAPDPLHAYGGTFGMRTAGHGSPGGAFKSVPASAQVPGSNNVFFGIE